MWVYGILMSVPIPMALLFYNHYGQTTLVYLGIYGVVRHPQYLGFIWITLGVVLMSQHWLSVICGVVGCLLFCVDIRSEERSSIARFGDAYQEYMARVPGMNLLSGLLRRRQRRGL